MSKWPKANVSVPLSRVLHRKCDALEARLGEIRDSSRRSASVSLEQQSQGGPFGLGGPPAKSAVGSFPTIVDHPLRPSIQQNLNASIASNVDVLRWAEELG